LTVHASSGAQALPAGQEWVSCTICGGQDFDPFYRDCRDRLHATPGRFEVVRCRQCGLVQTNPRPTREAIAAYYPQSYVAFNQLEVQRGRPARLLRELLQAPYTVRYGPEQVAPPPPPRGGRVLDVGCGSGLLLAQLARRGWEVWGIEPDERAARRLQARLGLPAERIVVATAETAHLPAGHFDLVTMSHVLEHLHDPRAALAGVHRWLRPGGRLRLWVPNIASLESRVFRRLWFGLDLPRHLYHFDTRSLLFLLRESGFHASRVVPQRQGFTLSGSLRHLAGELAGRRTRFRNSRPLHCLTVPFASVLAALGNRAVLDVTASRR
jgi:2-polyprenyl-3-methyl-5-hydroxy-6-metoxy-1,4-benzoquinol methylase